MASKVDETPSLPDHQISVGSYHSNFTDTLPCDKLQDDVRSDVAHDFYESDYARPLEEQPTYRVPKEHGVFQPVYEAWIIHGAIEEHAIEKTTFCGLPLRTQSVGSPAYSSYITTEPHEQQKLIDAATLAIYRHKAARQRSLLSRLFRGRDKSYVKDLDERIHKLPPSIQSQLDSLLGDRERATRNRFHQRKWTVTMIRERHRHRFASDEWVEVEDSRRPCFRNKGAAKQPSKYFFIIRGSKGEVANAEKGLRAATHHSNP